MPFDRQSDFQNRLQGNSILGAMQYDKVTDMALGFDIFNPNKSVVHINLSQYSKKDSDNASNNLLRQFVYEKYAFLAENVPAATALFESNAKTFPKGFVLLDADDKDVFSYMGYLKDGKPGKQLPVSIKGNVLAEDRVYRGKSGFWDILTPEGGVWYRYHPEEVLLHEHCHASMELQDWTPHAQRDYDDMLKQRIVPIREVVPIEFVNETMLKPREQPPRDPDDYFTIRIPADGVRGVDRPTDIEALRHGPIPDELKQYSHPKVNDLQSRSKDMNINDSIERSGLLHPVTTMSKLKVELSSFDSTQQQNFVFSRIIDLLKSNEQLQKLNVFNPELVI